MSIHEKMAMTAAEIKEKMSRGEAITANERAFLRSWMTSKNGSNAGNAGKVSMKTKVKHGY